MLYSRAIATSDTRWSDPPGRGLSLYRDVMAQERSIDAFDLSLQTLDGVVQVLDQSVRRIMLEAAHSYRREEVSDSSLSRHLLYSA